VSFEDTSLVLNLARS